MSIQKIKSLGINLGITNSCMAGIFNDKLSVIDNRDGERITPSAVYFNSVGGQPIVGSNATLPASSAPENYVYDVMRMLGKGFHHKDIQKAITFWPFNVQEIKNIGTDSNASFTDDIAISVTVDGKVNTYMPIQISAFVLDYLTESAKVKLGIFPEFVVITVPAYFNEVAKQRTLDAANIAFSGKTDELGNKLDVQVALLAEPTAAAIAYGSIMIENNQVQDGDEERILVFNLGNETYDVSVLDFSHDKNVPFGIIKATDGDNFLGGFDFDNVIVKLAKKTFQQNNPGFDESTVSIEDKKINDFRLRQEAIKVKSSLNTNLEANFNFSCYAGYADLTFQVTRTQFERACKDLFDKLIEKCKGVLLYSEGIFPVYYDDGKLNGEETLRQNPNVRSFGLDTTIQNAKNTINRVILVGDSSRIPKVKSVLEAFFNEDANTPIAYKKVIIPLNPDEAIAYGAGYYANLNCPTS